MKKFSYKGYRFPSEIIQQAIWLYVRFTLSFRDVEDLLAGRGIVVSYGHLEKYPFRASRSVVEACVSFERFSPRKSTSGLR